MSERLIDWLITTDHTPASQATILLVEDEERVRLAQHSFLQHRGYEVIGVGTVEEAEQCLPGRESENIAAIVSDINLHLDSSGHEGYTFLQRWTGEHRDLPFILISGRSYSLGPTSCSLRGCALLGKTS
jgi:DNA-binding NtrC family response regulator